jgi:hypothetical protein
MASGKDVSSGSMPSMAIHEFLVKYAKLRARETF